MKTQKRVVILGAGISGLSLAWHLEQLAPFPLEVILVEKSQTVGGKIVTKKISSALFELGPHTIRLAYPYKETCLNLIRSVGLEEAIIYPSKRARGRYLARDGKLRIFPMHPMKLLNPKELKQTVFPFLKKNENLPKLSSDPSIYDFFAKRYSPHIAEHLVDPMVSGIYGGDIKSLSLRSCFPLLDQLKNQKGRLLTQMLKHKKKHPSDMISFRDGIASLPKAIQNSLEAKFLLNKKVEAIQFTPNPKIVLEDETICCDHVFSTLPSHELLPLIKGYGLEQLDFLEHLKSVAYQVIHLGFSSTLSIPKGFGYLSPSWSSEKVAGVIFDSMTFPEHNSANIQTRLTVMIHERSPLFQYHGRKLIHNTLEELKKYLNIDSHPCIAEATQITEAITQYTCGHQEKLSLLKEELEQKLPLLSFLGSSFYGSSVPACIEQGLVQAKEYLKKMSYVTT